MQRFRDLLVFESASRLVLACDSIGGIGPKPADSVSVDARTVAHFGVRVPLLEVLCSGARPIALVNALCVERDPTGQEMIDEIEILAAQAGIPADAVTGSTEENAPTSATGLGITVIGALSQDLPKAQPGDVVICAGLPIAAPDFTLYIGHPDQVTVAEVRRILESGLVHDALPAGSHGVGFETDEMARIAGLQARWTGGRISTRSVRPARPAACCSPARQKQRTRSLPCWTTVAPPSLSHASHRRTDASPPGSAGPRVTPVASLPHRSRAPNPKTRPIYRARAPISVAGSAPVAGRNAPGPLDAARHRRPQPQASRPATAQTPKARTRMLSATSWGRRTTSCMTVIVRCAP